MEKIRILHLDSNHRLLAEKLADAGFVVARTWTFDADEPLHTFLLAAGWEPDGAHRELDMVEPVGQQRWHTELPAAAGR